MLTWSRSAAFDGRLATLKSRLLDMSVLADELVSDATQALGERDGRAADAVIAAARRLDAFDAEIDGDCHLLLALHHPVAADLRLVASASRVCGGLQRVGDHAVHIAFAVRELVDQPFPLPPEVEGMTGLAKAMLARALDLFVRGDAEKAGAVIRSDQAVDRLHARLVDTLVQRMLDDPRQIGPSMLLLGVGRDLERIADHATNFAEDVVYLVEGRRIRRRAEAAAG